MWDSLYPYFYWIEQTRLGHGIRESKWIFAVAEVFHLLGITLFLGTGPGSVPALVQTSLPRERAWRRQPKN